ncbi:MAG: hypothetical protein QM756_12850 [Polyangiaceae bacterium]
MISVLVAVGAAACSGSEGTTTQGSGGSGQQQGGSSAANGGATTAGQGNGGASGSSNPSGGSSNGGSSNGGSSNGGSSNGGSSNGGSSNGGSSNGGSSNGGSSNGGSSNGGSSAGGSTSGGSANGGSSNGGSSAGGSVSGGSSSGGSSSGGRASGGATSGGTASGGAASGGAASGGTTGTGGTITNGGQCSGTGEYTWPAYSPTVAYDYKDEYGELAKPTKDSSDVSGIAGRYTSDWWTFVYGSNKNSLVTSAAWVPMLQRFNTDFAYITDVMRWPRDGRARAGYYSAIYLYGSGSVVRQRFQHRDRWLAKRRSQRPHGVGLVLSGVQLRPGVPLQRQSGSAGRYGSRGHSLHLVDHARLPEVVLVQRSR